MKYWLLLILLFSSVSGCAMMEDAIFGPEPAHERPYVATAPAAGCVAPVNVNVAQTQEPELIQVRK